MRLILLIYFISIFGYGICQTDSVPSDKELIIGSTGIEFVGSELIFSRVTIGVLKQFNKIEFNAFASTVFNRHFNDNNQFDFDRYFGVGIAFYPIKLKQFNIFPSLRYRYGEYEKTYYVHIPFTNRYDPRGYYQNVTHYTNSIEFGSNISIYLPPYFMLKLSGYYGVISTTEYEDMNIIIRASLGAQFRF